MKAYSKIALLIVITLLILGTAAAEQTAQAFGSKVKVEDPDVGYPLSNFAIIGEANADNTAQDQAFLSYYDIGAVPGIYDNRDVVYLQFGSWDFITCGSYANRIVRANDIRMTDLGKKYPAGSKVKGDDSDIGQQLLHWGLVLYSSAPASGFYFRELGGCPGYSLDDPIYLKAGGALASIVDANDIRITANPDFASGSRVSNSDPDYAKPLLAVYNPPGLARPYTGQAATTGPAPIAKLAFFNANGNIDPTGKPIYDDPDKVYLDVPPLGVVSPNDVRLSLC